MSCKREPLLKSMADLSRRGIDCRSCTGECCTHKSNSMQITESEGLSVLEDLRQRGLLDAEMIQAFADTIHTYRLDVEIPSFGSRSNLRRTYTCPLYREGKCIVSFDKKPFGCLAFNPVATGAKGLSSGCRSDQTLLAENAPEGFKAPIPVMLKRLMDQSLSLSSPRLGE